MVERITLPESNVTGAAVFSLEGTVFVSLKNGSKAVVLRTSDLKNWEREEEIKNYKDKSIPILGKINGSFGIFATEDYIPFFKPIADGRKIVLKTPFLKKAVVTGEPVKVDGVYLLPVAGIPYGCRLLSPAVLESEDGKSWFLRGFISISEDFGIELRTADVLPHRDRLLAFMCSYFPVPGIFISESTDGGKSWSKPRFTRILGTHSFTEERDGKLRLYCSLGSQISVYESRDAKQWKKIETISLKDEVTHMRGSLAGEGKIFAVTYKAGSSELLLIN